MAIKAQNCYSKTKVSSYSSLGLILLSNACLLYPLCKKLCLLCSHHQDLIGTDIITLRMGPTRDDIPENVEELKNFIIAWLQSYGASARPFPFSYCEESPKSKDNCLKNTEASK